MLEDLVVKGPSIPFPPICEGMATCPWSVLDVTGETFDEVPPLVVDDMSLPFRRR